MVAGEMHKVNSDVTEPRYCGYAWEAELTFTGCIFLAAQHLRLVAPDETGFGWNNAQICDLSDRITVSIESDPTMLDALPNHVRVKLFDGLNLPPRLINQLQANTGEILVTAAGNLLPVSVTKTALAFTGTLG